MLELLRMQSTPSLPLLPGPLWPGVEAPDRVLSMGQIKLLDIKIVYLKKIELFEIERFLHLTALKLKKITVLRLNWIV